MEQPAASDYLLQPHICQPVSQALNQLYKINPKNPIQYLANALLEISRKQAITEQVKASHRIANTRSLLKKKNKHLKNY
jgi:Dpy-30 motif